MIPSYIHPLHVTEEYAQRLQDCARNAHVRRAPRESVLRQRLGQVIMGLREFFPRRHPSTIGEPADVRWVTD